MTSRHKCYYFIKYVQYDSPTSCWIIYIFFFSISMLYFLQKKLYNFVEIYLKRSPFMNSACSERNKKKLLFFYVFQKEWFQLLNKVIKKKNFIRVIERTNLLSFFHWNHLENYSSCPTELKILPSCDLLQSFTRYYLKTSCPLKRKQFFYCFSWIYYELRYLNK